MYTFIKTQSKQVSTTLSKLEEKQTLIIELYEEKNKRFTINFSFLLFIISNFFVRFDKDFHLDCSSSWLLLKTNIFSSIMRLTFVKKWNLIYYKLKILKIKFAKFMSHHD